MTRLADRSFVALVAIALLSSAILIALFVSLLPHLGEPVPALILALASIGILLGLASLARQLADTFALIRRLLRRRLSVPAPIAAVARELGFAGRLDLVGADLPDRAVRLAAAASRRTGTGADPRAGVDRNPVGTGQPRAPARRHVRVDPSLVASSAFGPSTDRGRRSRARLRRTARSGR